MAVVVIDPPYILPHLVIMQFSYKLCPMAPLDSHMDTIVTLPYLGLYRLERLTDAVSASHTGNGSATAFPHIMRSRQVSILLLMPVFFYEKSQHRYQGYSPESALVKQRG